MADPRLSSTAWIVSQGITPTGFTGPLDHLSYSQDRNGKVTHKKFGEWSQEQLQRANNFAFYLEKLREDYPKSWASKLPEAVRTFEHNLEKELSQMPQLKFVDLTENAVRIHNHPLKVANPAQAGFFGSKLTAKKVSDAEKEITLKSLLDAARLEPDNKLKLDALKKHLALNPSKAEEVRLALEVVKTDKKYNKRVVAELTALLKAPASQLRAYALSLLLQKYPHITPVLQRVMPAPLSDLENEVERRRPRR